MIEQTEIPKDILEAAEKALDTLLCNCSESCGGPGGVRKESIMDIAKAIQSERERCALIAEGNAKGYDIQRALAEGDDLAVGAKSVQLAIARKIRGEA